jgi:predicted RNA binding protein YcfA (HicA-like mRNA interferase family)
MSRLPTLNAKQVVLALEKAGFEEHFKVGGHRLFKHPITNMRTEVPMHGGDLKRGLMKKIIKQAGLTEEEFRKLF